MTQSTAVILVVGLNRSLIGDHSPHLESLVRAGDCRTLDPILPAVTCSVQTSMLTGLSPQEHGIVGNGWYNRQQSEVQFWKQSNHLIHGDKVWDIARRRDPEFTVLNMFWWYNMYSSANYSVTPRPIYKADGRKIPDCYTEPPELRDELQNQFGTFPLFNFWGPGASIRSSQWIADATQHLHARLSPALTLVYLPHLDYALQKLGPEHPDIPIQVKEIDEVVGELTAYFAKKNTRVVVLSEYGIEPVHESVAINRKLRQEGLVRIREEEGLELLDAGGSEAFAVADHQVAHIYVKDQANVKSVAKICRETNGIGEVYAGRDRETVGLRHERAGDIVLVAKPHHWFNYYYWLDDARAPDFARTVDIHRKPGYDPCELFLDPALACPKARIAWKLLKKKLGLRTLLDVIPTDVGLIKGSHGRVNLPEELRPVIILPVKNLTDSQTVRSQDLPSIILNLLFQEQNNR